MEIIERIAEDLQKIRELKPLLHHITNFVVMNECANATLSIGALPVMAHAREEVEEMAAAAGALILNIGTLTPELVDSMVLAGKRANQAGVPIIFDPVGAGATTLRTESSQRLLEDLRVDVVRGNLAEISVLAGKAAEIRGVESIGQRGDAGSVAGELARSRKAVVAVTGKQDFVAQGARTAVISNGHAMLSAVTGTGCMATTMVGAFAAVDSDRFAAAVGGLVVFGIAGEKAAKVAGSRPGAFHTALYDALAELTAKEVLSLAKVEVTG
jgi:hydroxyethylthiazole kinase